MSRLAIILCLAAALAAGCDSAPSEPTKDPAADTAGAASKPTKPQQRQCTAEDPLCNPALATEQAPAEFVAKLVTTKGDLRIEVHRDWSPNGADRFYNLVKIGFFNDVCFFRVVKGFMAQFGISGEPAVAQAWQRANIPDDPVKEKNLRGYVTFAKTPMPNTRSTQIFISYGDNSRLDSQGFAPFGKVIEGMEIVDSLYSGYGEQTTSKQGQIAAQGNDFLRQSYPQLDYIKSATIEPPGQPAKPAASPDAGPGDGGAADGGAADEGAADGGAADVCTDKVPLCNPALAQAQAPAKFKVKLTTTKGDFVIEVTRDWAPNGADRFYNLVKIGFFNDVCFFRVVKDFMAQCGIPGRPEVAKAWQSANIKDDPVKQSNLRGFVTFAKTSDPDSRSTQIFISFKDNSRLDKSGFAPFGKVVEGMEVVDSLYNGYGETTTDKQGEIAAQGNDYLKKNYPKLDYIKRAEIVP